MAASESARLLHRSLAIVLVAVVFVVGAVPNVVRPFLPGPMGDMNRSAASAVGTPDMAALTARLGGVVERLDAGAVRQLAVGRTDVPAPAVLPGGMDTARSECAEVAIVGVRGSGESATANNGLGETVNAAVAVMADHLDGHDVVVHAIDYPADPVSTLLTDPSRYVAGIHVGAGRLAAFLGARGEACPGERRIVVGFSQGAMVVHSVLADRGAAGAGARAATDAAMLVSDGLRTGMPQGHRFGSAEPSPGIGPALGLEGGPVPAATSSRLVTVCDAGDPVCNPGGVTPQGVDTHTSYKVGNTAMHDAAERTVEIAVTNS